MPPVNENITLAEKKKIPFFSVSPFTRILIIVITYYCYYLAERALLAEIRSIVRVFVSITMRGGDGSHGATVAYSYGSATICFRRINGRLFFSEAKKRQRAAQGKLPTEPICGGG